MAGVRGLIQRRLLQRTALAAVTAGWPVVPGAWWSESARRFVCDVPGCTRAGPHPVLDGVLDPMPAADLLAARALRRPEAVLDRWRLRPYSILLPTGETCDAVDLPDALGRRLAGRLGGPVIEAAGRWLVLTAAGGVPAPRLDGDVIVHGRGSWIMLPPSPGPCGQSACWLNRPGRGEIRLPRRDDVLQTVSEGRRNRVERSECSATVVAAWPSAAGPARYRKP